MRTLLLISLMAAVGVGCGDPIAGDLGLVSDGPPVITQPDPEAPLESTLRGPALLELSKSQPEDCAATAIAPQLPVEPVAVAGTLCVEEHSDAACPRERWRWTYDNADRETHEWYQLLDEDAVPFAYGPITTSYSHRWLYDLAGRLTSETRADGPSEPAYQDTTHSYDAADRLVKTESQHRPAHHQARIDAFVPLPSEEGAYTTATTYAFHASGELSREEMLHNGERQSGTRWDRNAEGHALAEFSLSKSGEWKRYDREYTASGDVAEEWTYTSSGTLQKHTWFAYDGAGTLRSMEAKRTDTGWRDITQYDAEGREVSYTQDEDDDGTVEYITTHEYAADGRLLKSFTGYSMDANGNPQAFDEVVHSYDNAGRLEKSVQNKRSRNATLPSGWAETTNTTLYTYSEDGRTVLVTLLLANRTELRETEYLTAERDKNQKLWQTLDADGDGTLDERTDWTWRPDGQLAQKLHDIGADGTVDTAEQWQFDSAGRVVRYLSDVDGDGLIDQRTEWRFGNCDQVMSL